MSCLGALISFFIYIGFLKQNLLSLWSNIPNANEMLDLWMTAGIVTIAGITTSFQTLGQQVEDYENRIIDDFRLTDTSVAKQNFADILFASIVSLVMQVFTFLITILYFKLVDQITIPNNIYLKSLLFMFLGALGATMSNQLIIMFIHSSTTFSRLSAVIRTVAGFAVATYLPYGSLSIHAQTLVKWVPSSYEAVSLRSLLLNQISKGKLNGEERQHLIEYLGIHFKINGYQLNQLDNIYMLLGMIVILIVAIIIISTLIDRKRIR